MTGCTLIIGNRNYSSWSLRGWLAASQSGIDFETELVRLSEPGSRAALLGHSPAGRVPVLVHGERVVWDSLAIIEYLAELCPAGRPCGRQTPTRAPWPARSRPRCTRASPPCAPTCR